MARMVRRDDIGLRTSGLLWAINEFVLWPLGLALTIDVATPLGEVDLAQSPVFLTEWAHEPGALETIESAPLTAEELTTYEPEGTEPAVRFARFLRARLEEMPASERALALERLRAILGQLDYPDGT
jgi:hypothetical protein